MNSTNTTPHNLVTDPVCGMLIDPATAAGSSHHDGTTYYFCAISCKSEFDTGHGSLVEAPAATSSCCGGGGYSRG
ncbi:MAG: YHS domain-containing protein [Thermoanaerobaculia bacterium]|jgi:Cu+-exporting ATPase